MPSAIVLDKNYLQGAARGEVHRLAAQFRLIMPGPLFFELLTTSVRARRKCFQELPQSDNPVELVDHIGALLKYEIANRQPAGLPSAHKMRLRFVFNSNLLELDYELPSEAAETIREMAIEADREIDSLVELSDTSPSLFPALSVRSSSAKLSAYREALQAIADPDNVCAFYANLESPDATAPFPPIRDEPASWSFIRWLQVKMIFATHLYVRHQGQLGKILTPQVRLNLEHDIHDAQILALGVLEGALATKEKKLREWFTLLNPGGTLIPQ
jgi:hypothetical protein